MFFTHFRHHTFKYVNKELEVEEHGPRFDMRREFFFSSCQPIVTIN